MSSRRFASICPSAAPYLTTICCTASPRQQRSTTTTQEARPVWTRPRQQQAAWVSSAGSTRCAEARLLSTSSIRTSLSNPSSAGLHGDGDAHVHGRHPGHVWARGVELPGLLWRLQRQVRRQAQSWLGRSSLRREGHRRSQQHHLQVNPVCELTPPPSPVHPTGSSWCSHSVKRIFNLWVSCSSNGGLDPWSAGGVTHNITDSLISILIPDGAHHLDLRYTNDHDPPSVRAARALEVNYFHKWIKHAKKPHRASVFKLH